MNRRTWVVLVTGLILFAPVALGSASDDGRTDPGLDANASEEPNATITVGDILAGNQTAPVENLTVPVNAPPGLGADDPWIDANGDEMFGALEMGPEVIRLNGRALSATLDGDLQFAGDSICLQDAANCEGQSISGLTPIVVDGSTVGLSTQGCADGELWKWTGSTWDCQPDDDTTYDGTDFALSDQGCASGEVVAGVTTDGSLACVSDQDTDSDTLAELACASDEITRYDGTAWGCSTDQDTTYDGTDFALSDQACASGEVVAGVDADGNIACVVDEQASSIDWSSVTDKPAGFADDVDNDTTYDGTDFALADQACASSEVVAGVDASGTVLCVVDQDTDSDTLAELNCASTEITRYDGTAWVCSTDQDTTYDGSDFALADQACASGEVVAGVTTDGSLACVSDQDTDSDTLAELNCASTEITRYDGSTWTCSTDQDTTYDGTDFALADQACASSEVVAGVTTDGSLACVVDQDTDTTYQAGEGLELDTATSPSTFQLTTACSEGEVLKQRDTDGDGLMEEWACSVDETGATDVWLLGGNAGLAEGEDFLGTTDETNLTLKVNGTRASALQLGTRQGLDEFGNTVVTNGTANLIGGSKVNNVSSGIEGATIGGGGADDVLGDASDDPAPNEVSGHFGTVSGGRGNTASAFATVSGGSRNTAAGSATVGGGFLNVASDNYVTVAGGRSNTASDRSATVSGGSNNDAEGREATIGGGRSNTASGDQATIAGGRDNTASGSFGPTISGGSGNIASDSYAAVPGGFRNTADGTPSLAAGAGSTAGHDGTFVWSDSTATTQDSFTSTGPDQFLVNATGGVGIGTNSPATALDVAGTVTASDAVLGGSSIQADEIDSAQVQERVSGSCSGSSAIASVQQDGTVSCQGDADTLDGLDGNQFLRSDTSDTLQGTLSVYEDLHIGTAFSTDDDVLTFDAKNEELRWNESLHQFELTDNLNLTASSDLRAGAILETHSTLDSERFADTDDSSATDTFEWAFNGSDEFAGADEVMELDQDGDLFLGGTLFTNAFDVAESYRQAEPVTAGELVRVDPADPMAVRKAGVDDAGTLGIVSTEPGVVLGGPPKTVETLEETWGAEAVEDYESQRSVLEAQVLAEHPELEQRIDDGEEEAPHTVEELALERFSEDYLAPVALAGRVPTQAATTNGPIEAGDTLTISEVPGVAEKADPGDPVVGKALEGLDVGTGTIEVFVSSSSGNADVSELETTVADQQEAIDQLETENEQLAQENDELRQRLDAIEERLDEMEES